MCQQCIDELKIESAARGWSPTEEQMSTFLWNCTCFPFGDDRMVREHISEAFAIDGDANSFDSFLSRSIERCEREMDRQMQGLRDRNRASGGR